jgi:hypothetical protein
LKRRKNTWELQYKNWLERWNIVKKRFLLAKKEMKNPPAIKLQNGKCKGNTKEKQQYYIYNINPTSEIKVKEYLKIYILWKERQILSELRTSLQRLIC